MNRSRSDLCLLTFFMIGCASTTPRATAFHETIEAAPRIVEDEAVVPAAINEVWNSLISSLVRSDFELASIDRESGLITLSYSSTSPTTYVDCGSRRHVFEQGDRREETTYERAGRGSFTVPFGRREVIIAFRRSTLEADMRVHLMPEDSHTRILVQGNYHLTTTTQRIGGGEGIAPTTYPDQEETFSFRTNGSQVCYSTGVLEKTVLSLAGSQ